MNYKTGNRLMFVFIGLLLKTENIHGELGEGLLSGNHIKFC